jgi:FkbM family methyltransferase
MNNALIQGLKSSLIGSRLETTAMRARWLLGLVDKRKHPELLEIHLEDYWLGLVLDRLLKPESCCIDIGAHLGSFLSAIMRRSPYGQHIAVEPIKRKASALKKRFPAAAIIPKAISDHNGTTMFQENTKLSGFSHIRATQPDQDCWSYEVPVITIDEIASQKHIDFIKLDTEGHELAALHGGINTIKSNSPSIIFECGSSCEAANRADLYGLINDVMNYRIYTFTDFLFDKGPMQFDEFRRCGLYPFRGFNFLALPCQKVLRAGSGQ